MGRTSLVQLLALLCRHALVNSGGAGRPTGGRPAYVYQAEPDGLPTVGIDVGAANTRIVILRADDSVAYAREIPTTLSGARDDVLKELYAMIVDVLQQSGLEKQVVAIGLALSGVIDSTRGICLSFHKLRGWRGVDLRTCFEERFGLRTCVEDSSRAQAVAEVRWGIGRNIPSFLYVNVGVGIGGGIIVDRTLFRVSSGLSGELGHVIVDEQGPQCTCGNRGCLEMFASGPAILRNVDMQLSQGRLSTLEVHKAESAEKEMELKDIVIAARDGDKLAYEALTVAGEYIGRALAAALNLLGIEGAVIGGGVAQAGEPLIQAIERVVRLRVLSELSPRIWVRQAEVGSLGGAMGAALQARTRYLHEVTWEEIQAPKRIRLA